MGFGEFTVVLLIALVVLGPKELPKYLRKAGQFAGRARDWAYDMRRKSGIDEILRMEGIDKDIDEIRKLTRGELTGIVGTVRSVTGSVSTSAANAGPYAQATAEAALPPPVVPLPVEVDREREYPRDGADGYDALADTAVVDEEALASSPLALDPLYARGDDAEWPNDPDLDDVPTPDARQAISPEAHS
jgi:sec-independent protein translocase protein TatB